MATIRTCKCGGYMNFEYQGSNIVFTCQMCGDRVNGTDSDRNRRTGAYVNKQGIQLRKLLKFATVDPANPRNRKKCPSKGCDAVIVTYVETQGTKKKSYKCPDCMLVFV
jgi:DNA-directed RNA polymerase subunit M/transcription elongation factor TFIIS